MSIRTEYKVIDGVEYTVTTFPARRGMQLKVRLAKKIAPALSELFKGDLPKNIQSLLDDNINVEHAAGAISKVFDSFTEEEFVRTVVELLSMTRYESNGGQGGREFNESTIDERFAGEYTSLYKVIAYVLKVNYGSFLHGVGVVQSTLFVEKTNPSTPELKK